MLKSSKIQLTNFEKKKGKKERKKLERIHQFISTVSTVSRTKVVNLDGLVARGSASFVPIHLTFSLSLSSLSFKEEEKDGERERKGAQEQRVKHGFAEEERDKGRRGRHSHVTHTKNTSATQSWARKRFEGWKMQRAASALLLLLQEFQ